MSSLVLLLICLCLYLHFLWKQRDLIIKSWNFPGPFNLPVIGSIYTLFFCRKEDVFNRVYSLQEAYPMGGKLWFGYGFQLIYSLHKPEHIQKILGNPNIVTKELIYKYFRGDIGEGIFTAPDEKWKKHRKAISPTFNQQILNSFVEIFSEKSLILNEVLSKNCDGREIEIEIFLSRCSLDIICDGAMGVPLDIQKTNMQYAQIVEKIFPLLHERVWSYEIFRGIFGYNKEEVSLYCKKFNEFSEKVIQMKMESMSKRKLSSVFIEEGHPCSISSFSKQNYASTTTDNTAKIARYLTTLREPPKRLAFLDYLLKNGDFSASELREEVNLFFLAATDTSTAALSFAFAVIGMFPEIQQKVYEEVVQVLGNNRTPEYADLSLMVYTERVIKETLRLFPIAPHTSRTLKDNVDLGKDGVLPKNAHVYLGLLYIHRNPHYWPDPLKFDPDRFLPEEVAKRDPSVYIPFLYGVRNCIGRNYAMMSMKVILATVIRKFKVNCGYKRIEDIKFKSGFVLSFRDGAKVSLTPRNLEE